MTDAIVIPVAHITVKYHCKKGKYSSQGNRHTNPLFPLRRVELNYSVCVDYITLMV